MNFFKKYWWLLVLAVLVLAVIIWLIAKTKDKPEYSELTDGPHLKGNPNSSVSVVEWSDFQCPACGAAFSEVKDIVETYGGRIKFEYRHFPLIRNHQYAFVAAEASECAADQGKFWEYHDLLFLNQTDLKKSDLKSYAAQVEGLDTQLWQDCLDARAKKGRVDEDLAEAARLRLGFTPTFYLNGQPVPDWGKLEEMIKALIEPMGPLKQATTTESL